MKINNENEIYILHFMFSYKYLHIKSSRIPEMKNNVNITYQAMGKQHITQNMEYMITKKIYIFKYIWIISLNKCESNRK